MTKGYHCSDSLWCANVVRRARRNAPNCPVSLELTDTELASRACREPGVLVAVDLDTTLAEGLSEPNLEVGAASRIAAGRRRYRLSDQGLPSSRTPQT